MTKIRSIYNNGKWEIAIYKNYRGYLVRVDTVSANIDQYTDYPIFYKEGGMAWDNPYRIPQYIRGKIMSLLNQGKFTKFIDNT